MKFKESDGKQLYEMTNYVFQDELPRILEATEQMLTKQAEQLKDRGGFRQAEAELAQQETRLTSISIMLEKWLRQQRKYLEPSWWKKMLI